MIDSSRTARQIIKARRDAAKAHRKGLHTLKSHALRAGLDDSTAGSVAGALRGKTKVCGIVGHRAVMVRRTEAGIRMVRNARRFSSVEFRALAQAYNPRAPRLVAARELLLTSV